MTTEPRRRALTTRDLDILRFMTAHRIVLAEDLAARFFTFDPITKKPNTDPIHACERRLKALADAEYVCVRLEHDGTRRRRIATLGPNASGLTCARPECRRVAPRMRAHHVRTLDAIRDIAKYMRITGSRIVEQTLEPDLRAIAQRGRPTRRGDRFEPIPDAALVVESRGGKRKRVAIEYVTSKYTDADIWAKHERCADFDSVYWYADRASTTARVERVKGESCSTLD